jgi:hypothetical protein
MFDEAVQAIARLRLSETHIDSRQFVIVAAKKRRFSGDNLDVLVTVRPENDNGCIVECWAQSAESSASALWRSTTTLLGGSLDSDDPEPLPDLFLRELHS